MAQHVLAVLRPDDHAWRPLGSACAPQARSGHVGELVAELRREQVDEGRRPRRPPGAGRSTGQEMDVGVRGAPAGGAQVDRPLDRDRELAETGLDDQLAAHRPVIEALDHLDLDPAQGQVDLERARDVGVRVPAEEQAGARVLEQPRVDLLAMSERRQVAPVRGDEPDPGRGCLAGHRDAGRRRARRRAASGRMLTRPSGLVAPASRSPTPISQPPTPIRASGARATSTTERAAPSAWRPPAPRRRAPADRLPPPSARTAGSGSGRDPIAIPRSTSGSSRRPPSTRSWRRGARTSGSAVPSNSGQRRDHDVGARSAVAEGHDAQTRRLFVVAQGDRVEPVGHVIVGCRNEVGDAGLGRAPGPGQDRERSAMAGRRIPAGLLARVRASPVERLVGPMADRRERHEPPADDPVGDLEAAAHVDRPGSPPDANRTS